MIKVALLSDDDEGEVYERATDAEAWAIAVSRHSGRPLGVFLDGALVAIAYAGQLWEPV